MYKEMHLTGLNGWIDGCSGVNWLCFVYLMGNVGASALLQCIEDVSLYERA